MFQDRKEAGLLLAQNLKEYKNRQDTIVLAIPRGGIVIGRQIANNLDLLFSVIVVKKLGAPENPELAIGALAPNGVKVIDWELVQHLGVNREYLNEELERKRQEVEEREKKYQVSGMKYKVLEKNIVILVDDGIATGATTQAAIKYIKEKAKVRIILAVPVIAKDTYNKLQSEVDELIALEVSESFHAVGQFYREFPQVTDEEVIKYLK